MSDYIKRQDVIDIIHKEIENTKSYIEHNTQINIKFAVEVLPTLDEKEIIRKHFERVLERLEEKTEFLKDCTKYGNKNAKQQEKSYSTMMMYEIADLVEDLVDIVKEECGISE